MPIDNDTMNAARLGMPQGRQELLDYRQHWIAYWAQEVTRQTRLGVYTPNEAQHMLVSNWLWAQQERLADRITLTPEQRAILLDALLECS